MQLPVRIHGCIIDITFQCHESRRSVRNVIHIIFFKAQQLNQRRRHAFFIFSKKELHPYISHLVD
jgi:hypothetical protein